MKPILHSALYLSLALALSLALTAGCAKKKNAGTALASVREAALMGEDIALVQEEDLNFVEPAATTAFADIFFLYDSPELSAQGKDILAKVSEWLKKNPSKHLLIEGHCDERGTREYNLALGEHRALSVRRYLTALGLAPEKLHTISYGEERPAADGHTETAWEKNRRAHFLVSQ